MNKEEVMKLAREAGLVRTGDGWTEPHRWGMAEIELFATLVAAAEREKILEICKEGLWDAGGIRNHLEQQDAAIRNRGKHE